MGLESKSPEEIQALAELADALGSDPKTRHGFLRLAKTANPNMAIPEIDIPEGLRHAMAEPLKQLDALTKKQEERDRIDSIEAKRRELQADGIAAADIPKIEKLMVEKGIANHKTALEHMRMSERAAEPTPGAGLPGVRRFDKPTLPTTGTDQKSWSYGQAYAAIDEMRGRKAAA